MVNDQVPGSQLRPGEPQLRITTPLYSTIQLGNARRISLRLVMDTLQRDVLFQAVISATLFLETSIVVM